MNTINKIELHQLIDSCDDEALLSAVKKILQATGETDWWDDLSEKDKNILMESETEYENGNYISHEEMVLKFQA